MARNSGWIRALAIVWIVACAALVGCKVKVGGKTIVGGNSFSADYSSPQATHATAKRAVDEGNWKAYYECLTPDARQSAAEITIVRVAFENDSYRERWGGESPNAGIVHRIFDRHGVAKELYAGDSPVALTDVDAVRLTVVQIPDTAALLGDIKDLAYRINNKIRWPEQRLAEATLEDVKVTDKTAMATLVMKEGRVPLMFKSIDGNWLMAIEYPSTEQFRQSQEAMKQRLSPPTPDTSDPFQRFR
jgi:hypothetical protein